MPYHLQLTSKEPRHDNTRLDLSEKELIDTVIKPYNEGKPIFCGGRNIAADNIERIKITYSEKESSELYPIIEKELEEERRSRKLVKSIPVEWYIVHRGRDVTDRFITGPPLEQGEKSKSSLQTHEKLDRRKIWVVYGRNIEARNAMFTFLRSLDLHPMEWEEPRASTDEPTPYIGQILDVAFNEAQAFLVLLTGDDEGRLREKYQGLQDPEHERVFTPQARQNVIFEAGMAFGHDLRRTILVELGQVRPFSNIAGRHVIRMNNSSEKRHELANRLETAGCLVNRKGTDWLSAGDFGTNMRKPNYPIETSMSRDPNLQHIEARLFYPNNVIRENRDPKKINPHHKVILLKDLKKAYYVGSYAWNLINTNKIEWFSENDQDIEVWCSNEGYTLFKEEADIDKLLEPYFLAEIRNKKSTYRRGEPILFRTIYRGNLTNGFFDNQIVAPRGQVFPNGRSGAWSWAPDTLDNDHPTTRGNLDGIVNTYSEDWSWIIPRNAPVGEYTVYMRVYNHLRVGERPIIAQQEDVFILV